MEIATKMLAESVQLCRNAIKYGLKTPFWARFYKITVNWDYLQFIKKNSIESALKNKIIYTLLKRIWIVLTSECWSVDFCYSKKIFQVSIVVLLSNHFRKTGFNYIEFSVFLFSIFSFFRFMFLFSFRHILYSVR